jgi:[acyl-carrier-protein] S-malonyltransferase
MRALEANGATAKLSLGLGVGEFNHLVHIGALEFEEALRLVDTRAAAFSQVPQGPMMVVRSVPVEAVEAVLPLARHHGVVELVIHVSPEQHVIAGSQAAVEAAAEELRRRHPSVSFKMLEVQHPAFGSLLAPAGKALQEAMASVKWKLASAPYIPNVLGTPVLAYTPEMYTEFLSRQVHSPIRWRQSIEFLAEREPDAIFAAVGPRSTTFDLIPDNWIANRRVKTDRPGDLARSFVHTAVELARRA